jgi:hypothetical protein
MHEIETLRAEIFRLWQGTGQMFKTYWLRKMNKAQRSGILTLAFIKAANTPEGEGFRKYLIDFSCDALVECAGAPFIDFAEKISTPIEFNINNPSGLEGKIVNVFNGWNDANPPDDELSINKAVYLQALKFRCAFARTFVGCRVTYHTMSMWDNLLNSLLQANKEYKPSLASLSCTEKVCKTHTVLVFTFM